MVTRPLDSDGDVLPVLTSTVLSRGKSSAAQVIKYYLDLMGGEWWENPSHGNQVLIMLKSKRYTTANADELSDYLTSYVRKMSAVESVDNVNYSIEGSQFQWSCTVGVSDELINMAYSLNL